MKTHTSFSAALDGSGALGRGCAAPAEAVRAVAVKPACAPKVDGAEGDAERLAVEAPFAAVSRAEAMAMALSPAQRTAIEKLTSGHTMVDSAAAAGVGRATLYRWLKNEPAFQAAFNAWQHDAVATARGRLLALTDIAVTAVGKAMQRGDGRLALKVLERMGIAERPTPGPTDAEEVKREQVMEKRGREIVWRKAQSEMALDEMMNIPGLGEFGERR